MPSLNAITGIITAIVFSLMVTGNGKLVHQMVWKANFYIIKELDRPWGNVSIFRHEFIGKHKKENFLVPIFFIFFFLQ